MNAADEHGMTPLHKAAVQGHADTVAELLAHGAHIDAKLTVLRLQTQNAYISHL